MGGKGREEERRGKAMEAERGVGEGGRGRKRVKGGREYCMWYKEVSLKKENLFSLST